MQRRDFLRGAVSLSAFPYHLFAGPTKKSASDVIELGPKKVKVTRLAMGTGTNGMGGSSNQTRKLGMSGLADLLRTAYDNGVCFFDSADQYGTHPYIKEALKKVPREKIAILTKTHSSTYNEMKADLDRFRKELGVDYIDVMLLHCMMDPDWPARKKGAMDFISEAQEKGLIKTKGTSCHTLGALKAAADSPWVEVRPGALQPRRRDHGRRRGHRQRRSQGHESLWQGHHRHEDLRRRQSSATASTSASSTPCRRKSSTASLSAARASRSSLISRNAFLPRPCAGSHPGMAIPVPRGQSVTVPDPHLIKSLIPSPGAKLAIPEFRQKKSVNSELGLYTVTGFGVCIMKWRARAVLTILLSVVGVIADAQSSTEVRGFGAGDSGARLLD